jgi:hypothetical protein
VADHLVASRLVLSSIQLVSSCIHGLVTELSLATSSDSVDFSGKFWQHSNSGTKLIYSQLLVKLMTQACVKCVYSLRYVTFLLKVAQFGINRNVDIIIKVTNIFFFTYLYTVSTKFP